MKKKKSKNEWRRRCEEETQRKKECLKHQWDHENFFTRNHYKNVVEAKINADKSEGISVTETAEARDELAYQKVEKNQGTMYPNEVRDYYQQNIQAKEEEKKERRAKTKRLFEAKVNFFADMSAWDSEKENNFLKDYEGDKDDSIAVQKEVLKEFA